MNNSMNGMGVTDQMLEANENSDQEEVERLGMEYKNIYIESKKKILERNGFVLEARRKKHLFYNGEYHTQLDYGLILGE